MINAFFESRLVKFIFSLFLIVTISLSLYSPLLNKPKVAEAQWAVYEVGANLWESISTTIQSTISAVANKLTAFYEGKGWLKEFVLDPLLWALVDTILQQMTRAMVDWINSGFKGQPMFIQNLNGFLIGVADRVAGEYIWGSQLSFLCSPFSLDIKLALEIQYKTGRNLPEPKCTLTSVFGNIQNFFNGQFSDGGWEGWFNVVTVPQNNPYGALATAQTQLSIKLSSAQGQEINLLSWGKGFLSRRECSRTDSNGNCTSYSVVTPGTTIVNQLDEHLASGLKRLHVADEIDEILGAFMGLIAREAMQGAMGLLGVSGKSADGSTISRFDPAPSTTTPGYATAAVTLFQQSIDTENKYLSVLTQLLQISTDAANYKDNTYGSASMCHSGVPPQKIASFIPFAQSEIAQLNTAIPAMQISLNQYRTLTDPTAAQTDKDAIVSYYGKSTVQETTQYIITRFSDYKPGPKSGEYAGDAAGVTMYEQQLQVRNIPQNNNQNPTIAELALYHKQDVDAACP